MNHYLRETLYELKKTYGRSVDLYKRASTIDIPTGRKVLVRQKIFIKKAIILPSLDSIRGMIDNASSKPGGYIEVADQNVIIDPKQIPKGFIVEPDDYIIIDYIRYEIKTVTTIEFNAGLMLSLKRAKGAQVSQIIDLVFKDKLAFFHITTLS